MQAKGGRGRGGQGHRVAQDDHKKHGPFIHSPNLMMDIYRQGFKFRAQGCVFPTVPGEQDTPLSIFSFSVGFSGSHIFNPGETKKRRARGTFLAFVHISPASLAFFFFCRLILQVRGKLVTITWVT
jgi:hypothetical protein